MDQDIDRTLLEAFSRGEISRKEIERRLDREIGFGDLLMQLHKHNLRLPRFASDPNSPGVQLIKRLAERGPHAG